MSLKKIITRCGLGFGASAVAIWFYEKKRGLLLASWTTGFEPSVRWDHNWDKRDPASLIEPPKSEDKSNKEKWNEKLKSKRSKATRHLLLIRHGQYNMTDSDATRTLTKLGQEQAHLTGQRLQELAMPYSILVHSTMTRAIETAEIIKKYLPAEIETKSTDLLREGAPIPPEPPIGSWRPEVTFLQDGQRMEAGFRKFFHRAKPNCTKDSYEVYVCHANLIKYCICRLLQCAPEAWQRFLLLHASITWVSIFPNGNVVVKAMGDCGHFPSTMLTAAHFQHNVTTNDHVDW